MLIAIVVAVPDNAYRARICADLTDTFLSPNLPPDGISACRMCCKNCVTKT